MIHMEQKIATDEDRIIGISLILKARSSNAIVIICSFITAIIFLSTISFIGSLFYHILDKSTIRFEEYPPMLSKKILLCRREGQS